MDLMDYLGGATEAFPFFGGKKTITVYDAEIYDMDQPLPKFNRYTRYLHTDVKSAVLPTLAPFDTDGAKDITKTKTITVTTSKAKEAEYLGVIVYQVDLTGYHSYDRRFHEVERNDDNYHFDNVRVYKTYTLSDICKEYGIKIISKEIDSKERRAVMSVVRKAVVDATKSCPWADTRVDGDLRDDFIVGDSKEVILVSLDIFKPNEKHLDKDEGDRRLEEMYAAITAGVKAGIAAIPSNLKSKYTVDSDGDKTDAWISLEAK